MRYLGIDYGKVRIGLALGENGLTMPLNIVPGKNKISALKEIRRVIEENEIDCIVLGIPKTHLGKKTKQTKKTLEFYNLLKKNVLVKVVLWGEEFTSQEALDFAIKMGFSKKKRKHLDNIAACMILKNYFQSKTTS